MVVPTRTALGLAFACSLCLPAAAAALDATVSITIAGEVITEGSDPSRPGEIPVTAYGLGKSRPFDPASGTPSGPRQYRPVSLGIITDKAMPKLLQACANEVPMEEVTLSVYKDSGGTTVKYLEIKMTDVLVSSYQTGGSSGDVVPVDQISLTFSQITVTALEDGSVFTDSWAATP